MLNESQAREFADHWVQAWNSHDLDSIMSHYAPGAVLVSPIAATIANDPQGTLRGKDALRRYFKRGLQLYPDLTFDVVEVMWGVNSVVIYYVNQRGTKTGEFMEFDETRRVVRVVANYNG